VDVLDHLRRHPELAAGGFTWDDHQVLFYSRVRSLLGGDDVVLDFGAGRGKFAEILADQPFKLGLVSLGDACRTFVGADMDPVVATNPLVDAAVVLPAGGSLPFADSSVDLIVSWAVFEHVAEPERCARELDRVLRPGGWLCAWTPNRWGIVGLGGRVVPNALHTWVLQRILGDARARADVFPTRYRMNTWRRLRELFPAERFVHAGYAVSGPQVYLARSRAASAVARAYQAVPGHRTAGYLHVFLQKRPAGTGRYRGPGPTDPSEGSRLVSTWAAAANNGHDTVGEVMVSPAVRPATAR
jgi:SAM-dependent methyltransferase